MLSVTARNIKKFEGTFESKKNCPEQRCISGSVTI